MRSFRRGSLSRSVAEFLFLLFFLFFFLGLGKKWLLFRAPSDIVLATSEASEQLSTPPQRRASWMNILFLGTDSVEGTHRTDTIILFGVNPEGRAVNVLSIPRDTRVLAEGAARKINEVMTRHGEEFLRSMIGELMEIQVDRFVVIDFQGCINLIDLIGGVEIDIEAPMNYDDNWGNVHIHFKAGPTVLDGKKALEYVRFRADANADLGRIKRQQKFISAVLQKMRKPENLVRVPQLLQEGFKFVQTNLTTAELVDLMMAFRGGELKFQGMSLPGEAKYIDKISYYIPYKDQAVSMGARFFSDVSLMDLEASFTRNLDPSVSGTPSQRLPQASVSGTPSQRLPQASVSGDLAASSASPLSSGTGLIAGSPAPHPDQQSTSTQVLENVQAASSSGIPASGPIETAPASEAPLVLSASAASAQASPPFATDTPPASSSDR